MTALSRQIILIQVLRAFAYGFGSILLGVTLAAEGFSPVAVGLLLTAITAGMATTSLAVARWADAVGRRRTYRFLLTLMAASGTVFALTQSMPWLIVAALTGTLATDTNDSGPISSLEQAMLGGSPASARTRMYGRYNAAAYVAGSVGALATGVPALLSPFAPDLHAGRGWFLVFPVAAGLGLAVSLRLGAAAEVQARHMLPALPGTPVRGRVALMATLFAVDSFGGGFLTQSFIAFWLETRFHLGIAVIGPLFFAGGCLQSVSSLLAEPIAARIGLVRTVAFSQVPGNLLIVAVALVPSVWVAVPCLLLRYLLSQADIPARQAFVMATVPAAERTAAAAYTNSARYLVRPLSPLLAGGLMQTAMAGPFLAGAAVKLCYDFAFYRCFRATRVEGESGVGFVSEAPIQA